MSKRKSITVLIIAVAVVLCGAVAAKKINASGMTKGSSSSSEADINMVSVKTLTAKTAPVTSDESFSASLEAYQEGAISGKIAGKVTQVFFENGQTVLPGEALVKLDETDIRNNIKVAEAQLAVSQSQVDSVQTTAQKAQIGVDTAQRNYDRAKTLYNQQIIPKSDFDNADSALKAAKVDLETAKAGIQAQQAGVQTVETNLSVLKDSLQYTTLAAPIGGVISGKSVAVGQMISAGMVLGKVEQTAPIYADIEVKESDLNFVKLGAKAKFLLNGDSTEYDGDVEHIEGSADPSSREFECKIAIQNRTGALKPGVFGNVEMTENSHRKAVTLPVRALGGSAGEYYVFLNRNGVARKQTVITGEILQNTVEIKSGVKDGDSVICTNVATLQDGDAVKAVAE